MEREVALLLIVYDRAVDTDLMRRLEGLGIDGYTKLRDAEGLGGQGLKRGDAVFPGLNNLLLIATPKERIQDIIGTLKAMQNEYALKPGITIWLLKAEEL